jgi:hypothetical protein
MNRSRLIPFPLSQAVAAIAVVGAIGAAVMLSKGAAESAPAAHDGLPGSNPALGGDFTFWSAPGSAGIVDDADGDLFKTTGSQVTIPNGVDFPAVLNLVYPITATSTFTDPLHTRTFLLLTYRDNGEQARIIARIKATNRTTAEVSTVLTFDSNDFDQQDDFQTNFDEVVEDTFNFTGFSYHVEVVMTRSANPGRPTLALVQVGRY